ncbi:MAG: hypothetical protein RLZZ408_1457 [Verrucomicrobiota bacterium]
MQRNTSFARKVPDLITEELMALFSGQAGPLEFKEIFTIIHERLKSRNAATGGEEMLRLRAYEKLQHLIQRNLIQKQGKNYRAVGEPPGAPRKSDQPNERMTDRENIPSNTHDLRLALHALAQQQPELRKFLVHLSVNEDVASTDINEVARIIQRTTVDLAGRVTSSSILQGLAGLGLGTFSKGEINSTHGISPNCIIWSVSTRSLGRFFLCLESEVKSLENADPVEEDEVEEILEEIQDEEEDDDIEFSADSEDEDSKDEDSEDEDSEDEDSEDEDSEDEDSDDEDSDDEDSDDEDSDDEDWMSYSFPLREDLEVEFALPKDITYAEAKRMARFLMSLPLDQD